MIKMETQNCNLTKRISKEYDVGFITARYLSMIEGPWDIKQYTNNERTLVKLCDSDEELDRAKKCLMLRMGFMKNGS